MSSIELNPDGALVVRAQPISVVKDPVFLNRLKKAFQDQIKVSVLFKYLLIPYLYKNK